MVSRRGRPDWVQRVCLGGLVVFWPAVTASQDVPPLPQSAPPDVVVQGERDPKRLTSGEWRVDLSRSYAYGRPIDDANETRPMGRDRSWRFCLADTQIEPLIRLLIGEGSTESAGATHCTRLNVSLGDGRLKAYQTCDGASMPADRVRPGISAEVDTRRTLPARDVLTIMGTYSLRTLKIAFDSRREPVDRASAMLSQIDGRRWSITAARVGDCPLAATKTPRE